MHEITIFQGLDASSTRNGQRDLFDPTIIMESMWAPGVFEGNVRANARLESIQLLVLDIDEGCSLQGGLEYFKDYKHVIGTSKSHGVEKNGIVADRFRVILFLDKPATSDAEFKEYWFAAFAKWPFIDKACKDSARFFYPCKEIISVNEDGVLFGDRLQLSTPINKLSPTNAVAGKIKGKLSKATKDFLVEGDQTPQGEWHAAFLKAVTDFKEQGFSEDEARLKLTAVTGHLDDHDEHCIEDVYSNRPSRYGPRGLATGLRDVILKSKYLVNISDPSECVLLDTNTGNALRVAPQVVAQVLGGRNDQALYRESNFIYAKFDYDRFGSGPFYLNDEMGVHIYNAYIPPTWQHDNFFFSKELPAAPTELPKVYDEFFTHLTDGNQESKDYLVDWLATAIQGRNYTLLTALGEPGVGKGVLGEIMERMFGEHNFVRTRDEIFKNKFNGQLRNKALVYIDEVALKGADDHNRLKDIVNDKIEVEQKGKDATYIKNSASYYLSSNQLDAIKPEAGDRRFSIIQLTDVKLNATPLIGRLGEMMLPENIGALALYLRTHKVTRDMLTPFFSARSDDVKEAGLTDWEAYVIFEWAADNEGKEVPIRSLQEAILERFGRFKSPPGRRRIEELRRKYPEYLQTSRAGNQHKIKVLGSPEHKEPRSKIIRFPSV